MRTVYDWLCSEIDEGQIETIVLPSGHIEYRIWTPSGIYYNGKLTKKGRKCEAKYLASPNGLELCFNERLYKKDKRNENFTEDNEFYQKYITDVEIQMNGM